MPQCHRGSVVFACQKLSNSHKIHLVSIAIALAIVSCLSGTQRRVHKQTHTKPPAAGREKREVCFIIFHLGSPTLCVRFCTVVSPCYSHSSSRACRVVRVESGDMKEFSWKTKTQPPNYQKHALAVWEMKLKKGWPAFRFRANLWWQ